MAAGGSHPSGFEETLPGDIILVNTTPERKGRPKTVLVTPLGADQ
jgi:hypothetical protein